MIAENKTGGTVRLAYTVPEAAEAVRLSVDSIQKAIRQNEPATKRYGTKPLVPVAELQRWFESLPD